MTTGTPPSAPTTSGGDSLGDVDAYNRELAAHDAEPIYSTVITRALHLRSVNRAVHSIPSLHPLLEFLVFLFGYAFNPVVVPAWIAAAHRVGASSHPLRSPLFSSSSIAASGELEAQGAHPHALFAPAFSLATLLITLVATEGCKASFAATRPEGILSEDLRRSKVLRRYGALASSLKSRHSFPSGDVAQAANMCLFLWRYVPCCCHNRWVCGVAAFGAFLPGVCFARVFYHCHWAEDCLGGVALAVLLHAAIVPSIGRIIGDILNV